MNLKFRAAFTLLVMCIAINYYSLTLAAIAFGFSVWTALRAYIECELWG